MSSTSHRRRGRTFPRMGSSASRAARQHGFRWAWPVHGACCTSLGAATSTGVFRTCTALTLRPECGTTCHPQRTGPSPGHVSALPSRRQGRTSCFCLEASAYPVCDMWLTRGAGLQHVHAHTDGDDGVAGPRFNDLYWLELATLTWHELSSQHSGLPPSSRASMGMTATPSRIYVFGGSTSDGEPEIRREGSKHVVVVERGGDLT